MTIVRYLLIMVSLSFFSFCSKTAEISKTMSGNPILDGWYADPEGTVFGKTCWIFPTCSAPYDQQVFLDAFSSKDLITWKKYPHVLDTSAVKWAHRAMWAPAIIEKESEYYLFFSANDVQRPGGPMWEENDTRNHYGGIGVAVADSPSGPYIDYLGHPLISDFYNDAQPIDQFVFRDTDSTYYIIYGGWRHCNMAKLKDDFTGFLPWDDGTLFQEITPDGYVEGPVMILRNGTYYFMWSEGNWGDGSYRVAYAMSKSATGPFRRLGVILQSDDTIATGAGHHSVIQIPGTDQWYIVYHRRPIPNKGRDHRVTCIDRLYFNRDGTIRPVRMTINGVRKKTIE